MELLPGLSRLRLPPFHLVGQAFAGDEVGDVAAAVRAALAAPGIAASLRPGLTAAVAVGSRGIAGLPLLVATLVAELTGRGLKVFLVPAMGSHGGGSADGQRAVLARYGVTAESAGAPIRSDMATEAIGALRFDAAAQDYVPVADPDPERDVVVRCDRVAWREADLIIPVVRVKPHTGFRGPVESGICKMLAIGLAKHEGCARLHREGYGRFARLIPAAAGPLLASGRVPFALAVVENAAERLAVVEAVPAARVLTREPALLEMARTLLPRLLLPRIDVLVVEEIGKDISGVGMDSNIIGRAEDGRLPGFTGPDIHRIVVLGLSAATKGNATGLGMADLITERAFAAIDRTVTATNVLTSGSLEGGRIPTALPSDDEAILAAASCVPGVRAEDATIVRIRSTRNLARIAVSENLVSVARATAGCTVEGPFAGRWP